MLYIPDDVRINLQTSSGLFPTQGVQLHPSKVAMRLILNIVREGYTHYKHKIV